MLSKQQIVEKAGLCSSRTEFCKRFPAHYQQARITGIMDELLPRYVGARGLCKEGGVVYVARIINHDGFFKIGRSTSGSIGYSTAHHAAIDLGSRVEILEHAHCKNPVKVEEFLLSTFGTRIPPRHHLSLKNGSGRIRKLSDGELNSVLTVLRCVTVSASSPAV